MALRDDIRAALRIPAREVTDEPVYRERRRVLAALAAAPALGLAGCADAEPPAPSRGPVSPALAGAGFDTDETLTTWQDVTTYNNYYEFGTGKLDPSQADKTIETRWWAVAIGGHCARPGTVSLDDLLAGLGPEERTYRLRCVEGWSMVIPWLGVPLADVLRAGRRSEPAQHVGQRHPQPRDHHRPALDAAQPVGAFFLRHAGEQLVERGRSRLRAVAAHRDRPPARLQGLLRLRGVELAGAELVEVVVAGGVLPGGQGLVRVETHPRQRGRHPGARRRGRLGLGAAGQAQRGRRGECRQQPSAIAMHDLVGDLAGRDAQRRSDVVA